MPVHCHVLGSRIPSRGLQDPLGPVPSSAVSSQPHHCHAELLSGLVITGPLTSAFCGARLSAQPLLGCVCPSLLTAVLEDPRGPRLRLAEGACLMCPVCPAHRLHSRVRYRDTEHSPTHFNEVDAPNGVRAAHTARHRNARL